MKVFRTLSLLLIILLTAFCQPKPTPVPENSIAFTPDSLIFEQPGGELRFYVTASAPGIEVYSTEDWVVSIEPPYSAMTEQNFDCHFRIIINLICKVYYRTCDSVAYLIRMIWINLFYHIF